MSITLGAIPATGLRGAAAQSIRDLAAHPGPLIAANVAWGVVAFGAWLGATIALALGIALALLLAWPAATIARLAGQVVRGEDPLLRDAFRWPLTRPAVAVLGAIGVVCGLVGVVDIGAALGRGDLAGIAFATLAGWGLVALAVLACVAWPLLGDPARADMGTRDVLRLAATIALARTPRILAAWLVVGVLLMVSTVLAAAIITVSVSLSALFLARVVLPLADALAPRSR